MNVQAIFFLLSVILILGLSSCHSNVYVPNEAYMMGLANKGDLKVSGSYFKQKRSQINIQPGSQFNIQVAYSPINRWAFVASRFNQEVKTSFSLAVTKKEHTELALGYYHKAGIKKETDVSFVLYDLYAGTGWGNNYSLFSTAGESHVDYRRFFIHSGIHFWWKNQVSVGLGLRYTHTNFGNIDLIGKIPESYAVGMQNLQETNPKNFMEGTFRVQGGSNRIKIFGSFTGVLRSKSLGFREYTIGPPTYNLGLMIDLDEFWRKKKIK